MGNSLEGGWGGHWEVLETLEEIVAQRHRKRCKKMSDISPSIGNAVVGNVGAVAPAQPTKVVEVEAPAAQKATDRVEFSEEAMMLEKMRHMPAVRQERIDAIKASIAANTYVTNGMLESAINRMIDEVSE